MEHAIGDRLERFPTALVAKVLSFDSKLNTCSLEIMVTNAFEDSAGKKQKQWPKVNNIPVLFQGSGKHRITVPIKAGDLVVYLISSIPISNWIQDGVQAGYEYPSVALNSISSGFAIPGLFSLNKPPGSSEVGYDNDAVVIHGQTKLGALSNTSPVVLERTLDRLMTTIQVVITGGGDPTGTLAALKAALVADGWPSAWCAQNVEGF